MPLPISCPHIQARKSYTQAEITNQVRREASKKRRRIQQPIPLSQYLVTESRQKRRFSLAHAHGWRQELLTRWWGCVSWPRELQSALPVCGSTVSKWRGLSSAHLGSLSLHLKVNNLTASSDRLLRVESGSRHWNAWRMCQHAACCLDYNATPSYFEGAYPCRSACPSVVFLLQGSAVLLLPLFLPLLPQL